MRTSAQRPRGKLHELFTGAASAAFAACLAWAGCASSGNNNAVVSATIGSQGGKLELPGTGSVVIPPGAVGGEVTVQLAVADPPIALPSPAESTVVAITPHGLQLAMPAKVSLRRADGAATELTVLRLAGPNAKAWAQIGGASNSGLDTAFETTTFSYYGLVAAACTPAVTPACSASCECCGTTSCVDVATSPKHCGACGNDCGASAYCNSSSTCTNVDASRFCDNRKLLVVYGELPDDIVVVSPEQTTDGASATTISEAIVRQCGLAPAVTISQAADGVLDPCTDAPMQTGGTLDVIVGGTFGQRIARFLDANGLAPYRLREDAAAGTGAFLDRAGAPVVEFPLGALNPGHDYFVIALIPEPERGALVLHVFGAGWEGTPAAAYYFANVVLPEIVGGTRSWRSNLLVEWSDDGDGIKSAGDTFAILAQDR